MVMVVSVAQDRSKVYQGIEEHYRKNFDNLVRLYAYRLHSVENAEEAIQNAYVRALSYWEAYNVSGSMDRWMSRIIQRAVFDAARDWTNDAIVEFEPDEQHGFNDNGYYIIFNKRIFGMIAEESDSQIREILWLYFKHGFSAYDIAEITNQKRRTIEQYIYRFRGKIKEKYGESVCS